MEWTLLLKMLSPNLAVIAILFGAFFAVIKWYIDRKDKKFTEALKEARELREELHCLNEHSKQEVKRMYQELICVRAVVLELSDIVHTAIFDLNELAQKPSNKLRKKDITELKDKLKEKVKGVNKDG